MTLHNQKQIVAVDDGRMFGRAYAELMRLPFNRGWAQWAVLTKDGMLLFRSSSYRDCSEFLKR